MALDFVFMLTRADRTVPEALSLIPTAIAAGVRHIGFKDVGLPVPTLKTLAGAIRGGRAALYLEVVSLDEASERASAKAAVELGVDVLMGGTRPHVVLPILKGTGIRYYPFAGHVSGHPSVLDGPIDAIVDSVRALADCDGVDGLDLLAYRFRGDVPELLRRVATVAAPKPVIVAGSINGPERIRAVAAAGAAGFTVGTAALDGVFPAISRSLVDQLSGILSFSRAG